VQQVANKFWNGADCSHSGKVSKSHHCGWGKARISTHQFPRLQFLDGQIGRDANV